MDSMRSLNTSLPRSPPKQRPAQIPEPLHQAFKAAALSVTKLYKTAASDQVRAREAGYQDALDDILAFLDKENIGLGDGEGWRVRRWATQRLDGSVPIPTGSESEDDRVDTAKRARSSSPVVQRKESREILQDRQPSRSMSPAQLPSAVAVLPVPLQQPGSLFTSTKPEIFSFRSSHQYPQDTDMSAVADTINVNVCPSDTQTQQTATPAPTSAPAVRVEVVPRGSRTPLRNGNHASRHATRAATNTRSLGSGAGSKRRIPLGEYFDIGTLGDGREGSGGGKRSRLI